jgi:hypothetical protein
VDHAVIEAGGMAILKATAMDPDGSVANVEFFNGNESAGVVGNAPYELHLHLPAGVHSFTAKATDNRGGETTSGALEIYVAARPVIATITRADGSTSVKVNGTTGIPHTLEGSGDLDTWTAVGTGTPEDGELTVTDEASAGHRFYRAVVRK